MYIDNGTLLAIVIALVSQLITMIVLFRSSYKWEQHYKEATRLLKQERTARAYWDNWQERYREVSE